MIAVETLRRLLADELESVARDLLRDVKLEHGELRGRGTDDALWILELGGRKRGLCLNAATNEGCNAFDFVRLAGACASVPAACRLAESLLGLADAGPARQRELARNAAARRIEQRAQAERDASQRREDFDARGREYEQAVALHEHPDAAATQYLGGRACLPDPGAGAAIRSAMHVTRDLRPTGCTMLAPLIGPDGAIRAWHETALARDRNGGWRKAAGTAKRVWGQARGGLIPLALGSDPATLLLSEGIENGLSGHLLLPELEAAAAYAVGNLAHIELHPSVRRIVLVRDREANPRSHGPRARAAALARWWSEGRTVSVLDPPAGCADLNDAMRARPQRNKPTPDAAEILAASRPIAEVEAVAAFVAGFGEAPDLALAHPGIEAGGRHYPALVLRAIGVDGAVQGLALRLIDAGALIAPVLFCGERAGTVLPLSYPSRAAAKLAIGVDQALRSGAEMAVLDLSHLAEAAVPSRIYRMTVLADPPPLDDDLALWRRGVTRLADCRDLSIAAAAPELHHAC